MYFCFHREVENKQHKKKIAKLEVSNKKLQVRERLVVNYLWGGFGLYFTPGVDFSYVIFAVSPNFFATNLCDKVGHRGTAKMDRAISIDIAELKMYEKSTPGRTAYYGGEELGGGLKISPKIVLRNSRTAP